MNSVYVHKAISLLLLLLSLSLCANIAGMPGLPLWTLALLLTVLSIVLAFTTKKPKYIPETSQQCIDIDKELYRLVLDQSNDIVFDWDILADRFTVSSRWQERFGYPAIEKDFSKKILLSPNLYPDDVPVIKEWILQLRRGIMPMEASDVRIRTVDKHHVWIRINASILRDNNGKPVRIVGTLRDVDKECREMELLRTTANSDSLTGLYNKAVARRLAEEYISEIGVGEMCALMLLDVDNFKQINDTMGHPFGDRVLCDVASWLQHLFRESDIIGRAGGDEFTVFLKNIPHAQLVYEKATAVTCALREHFSDSCEGNFAISCSIGVALLPQHGKTYDQLYEKADAALYSAKAHGKDGYCVYSPVPEHSATP